MPYPGSSLELKEGVDPRDPEVLRFLQASNLRNSLISRQLAVNGALEVPLDVVGHSVQNNWEGLANNERFQSIVQRKPFGVLSSTSSSVATLFVHLSLTNEICEWLEKEAEKELAGTPQGRQLGF